MSSLKRHDANGTALVGYVRTTYAKLVEAFGEPHYRDGDKVTCEWGFALDSVVFTIYDWKESATPMQEYDWHIGGMGPDSVDAVKQYFSNARLARS